VFDLLSLPRSACPACMLFEQRDPLGLKIETASA
jgi:hypothetical protein